MFNLIDSEREIYNLAFGDYKEETNEVDDLSVSNNHDRSKILATVAAVVVDFSEKHPMATIVAPEALRPGHDYTGWGSRSILRTFRIFFMLKGIVMDGSPFRKIIIMRLFSKKKIIRFTYN